MGCESGDLPVQDIALGSPAVFMRPLGGLGLLQRFSQSNQRFPSSHHGPECVGKGLPIFRVALGAGEERVCLVRLCLGWYTGT